MHAPTGQSGTQVRQYVVAEPTQPRVKGVAFRTIDACFEELRGAEARDRARDRMPKELGDGYRYGTILAASWYPIAWYREVFRAFREATGESRELPRQIGMLAAKKDMSGVHRQLLAKMISPQRLLGMSGRVFNTYYEVGTFQVLDSRPGYVHARCEGCVGWDANMWSELLGSCTSLLEVAGGQHVRLRVLSGGGDEDEQLEVEGRWT